MYAKFSKCEFWLQQVAFLGHIVSADGIMYGSIKVKLSPNVRDLPTVTELMRKGEKFVWTDERQESFEELKRRLVSAPILTLPSGSGGFQIYSDASKKAMRRGSVAIGEYEDRVPNLVLHIKKLKGNDGELWAIVRMLKDVNQIKPDSVLMMTEIVRLHGTPTSIVVRQKIRSLRSHFGKDSRKLGELVISFSTSYHPQTDVSQRGHSDLGRYVRALCFGMDRFGMNICAGGFAYIIVLACYIKAAPFRAFARSRQNGYADKHRRDLEFQVGDRVFLKVSPFRGVKRFGIKGKLSPRFIGPFEILERIGEVSYRLALPPQLSHVHDVFHVSLLRGYHYHPLHVASYPFDQSPRYILWKNHPEREATWETEESMRARLVIFGNVSQPEFVYHGSSPLKSVKLISAMKARTLISHGCQGFLASVMDTSLESPNIENLSVVREFADVFPDELS
ncbi:putative nucleotidyltransferase, ribonuclease H [Tanacetum coccineum]